MDMQGVKVDPVKIEQGDWIDSIPDMGDLRLKVRGVGNADWRKLQARLISAVPRGKRAAGRLDPDEVDRITSICLRDTGVTDWENLTDKGAAIPYSKEAATLYLTDPSFRAFRDAALWACTVVGDSAAQATEADIKN
jgi:hypothetical protein